MRYMRRMEYMHYLWTQWRVKMCMLFATFVQYVIDVLVREKVPPYLCLWPSYDNFYREEKKNFLRLPNQKHGTLRHEHSCCFFKLSELTAFFGRDLCGIRLLYVRQINSTPFWQNLKQFDCSVCNVSLFVFRDKKLVGSKNKESFGEWQVVSFQFFLNYKKRTSNFCKTEC